MTVERDVLDKYGFDEETARYEASLRIGHVLRQAYDVFESYKENPKVFATEDMVEIWKDFSGFLVVWWNARLEDSGLRMHRELIEDYIGLGRDRLYLIYASEDGLEKANLEVFLDNDGQPDFGADEWRVTCEVVDEDGHERSYEMGMAFGYIKQMNVKGGVRSSARHLFGWSEEFDFSSLVVREGLK